jgi:SNF2 family DNA or RNA helicase
MTTTTEIAKLADWSEPKKVSTMNGPRILRTAFPSNAFRAAWRTSKEALKAAGLAFRPDKRTGEWTAYWWQPDVELAKAQETAIAESKASDAQIDIPVNEGLAYLPYQRAGIKWASERVGALIADEMGLGKTIQAIGVINADPSIKRVLVICPASLKLNWAREARKWLTRAFEIGVVGKNGFPQGNFVIVNYDVAAKFHKELHSQQWDLVVIDEGHYCKNPKAKRTIALLGKWDRDPSKVMPALQATRKIVLTGSPILNRPIELQPILGFLDSATFGNFWAYAKRYCAAYKGQWGWDLSGASNLEELQRKLRTSVMIRRMKAEVLTELPPKRRQVIEIAANGNAGLLDEEQEAAERNEALLAELRDKIAVAKLLEDKEGYAAAVEDLQRAQFAAFEDMSRIRHQIALAKVPSVVEHVADACEAAPVVVFAHHRDVVDAIITGLAEREIKSVKLVGGMSDQAKQASVDAFQAGGVPVFVGNIKAAGVGITLTKSSHVVFAELDWVPANMSQAEDRTHRIGQRESVLVQHIVLEGSLDARMAQALVDKQDIADAALDNNLAAIDLREPVSTVSVKDAPVSVTAPTTVYSAEKIAKLHRAMQQLAGVCDYAQSLDGQGFNGRDAEFGHILAGLPTLTQGQAEVAAKLARRYRRQLAGFELEDSE